MIISATKTNNIYLLSLKFKTPSSQIIWSSVPFFGCTKMKSSSENLINKILILLFTLFKKPISFFLYGSKLQINSHQKKKKLQINDGNFGNIYIITSSL